MKEVQIPDYKAEVCVAFARGNIGKARLLASSEDFENVKAAIECISKEYLNLQIKYDENLRAQFNEIIEKALPLEMISLQNMMIELMQYKLE